METRKERLVIVVALPEPQYWKEYSDKCVKLCSTECEGDCTEEWVYERPRDGQKFKKTLAKTYLFIEEEWDELTNKFGHDAKCPECGGDLYLHKWGVFQMSLEMYDEAQKLLMEKLDEVSG